MYYRQILYTIIYLYVSRMKGEDNGSIYVLKMSNVFQKVALKFANLPFLNKAGIHALLAHTFQQLFQQETSDEFTDNVDDY